MITLLKEGIMKKWEYKREVRDFTKDEDFVDYLNEEGEDGWELIKFIFQPINLGVGSYYNELPISEGTFFFKRVKEG
jgi:hypothetical protein